MKGGWADWVVNTAPPRHPSEDINNISGTGYRRFPPPHCTDRTQTVRVQWRV